MGWYLAKPQSFTQGFWLVSWFYHQMQFVISLTPLCVCVCVCAPFFCTIWMFVSSSNSKCKKFKLDLLFVLPDFPHYSIHCDAFNVGPLERTLCWVWSFYFFAKSTSCNLRQIFSHHLLFVWCIEFDRCQINIIKWYQFVAKVRQLSYRLGSTLEGKTFRFCPFYNCWQLFVRQ